MIFSSNFLLVVTFSHVLHLGVLRRQIELKLKVKTDVLRKRCLMYGYNVGPVMAVPIYTVLYHRCYSCVFSYI